MKWTDVPVHVIDFEGSVRTGVVEYGVVTLTHGAITVVHTRVCRPVGEIPAAEARVHGLAGSDVTSAEPFASDWLLFAGLRETGVLAAHFSATEQALLRATWPCPRLSPDFLTPGRRVAEWSPWIDTGRLAIGAQPSGGGGAALEDVVRAYGLEAALTEAAERWCPPSRRRFHCAGFDALACALLLQRLARDEFGEAWTLARVLAASTADARQREARQQARLF